MPQTPLERLVTDELSNMKALDIRSLPVSDLTTITDTMIIASGTSDRHTRAIAQNLVERAKTLGVKPLGVEGTQTGEWILVDLGDVIIHIMLPRIRDFYNVEKLWSFSSSEMMSA